MRRWQLLAAGGNGVLVPQGNKWIQPTLHVSLIPDGLKPAIELLLSDLYHLPTISHLFSATYGTLALHFARPRCA